MSRAGLDIRHGRHGGRVVPWNYAEPAGRCALDLRMPDWHDPCVVRVVRNVAHLSSLVELRPGVELVVPNLALRALRTHERDLDVGDRVAS